MSQRPGQRSLSSLRRWTSSSPVARRDDDEHGPVAQPLGPHPPAGHRGHDAVVVVDDVDQLVARRRSPRSSTAVPTMTRMTVDTPRLREEANDLLSADRRAAPHAAPVARGRQRPAGHPGARARRARGPAARRHGPRDDERHRRPAHRRPAGPDDPAARRHGRPADARGHRARLRLAGRRRRCTPAATTPTRRCSSARPSCSPARRDDLAGRVLFMFQPGEEGHHGARFMLEEGLLDVPAAGRRHAVAGHRRVRPPHHVGAAVGLAEQPRRARSWRRPTG